MFRHVTLDEDRGDVWVEPDGKQDGAEFKCVGSQNSGFVGDGKRVKVDNSMENVVSALAFDPLLEGP